MPEPAARIALVASALLLAGPTGGRASPLPAVALTTGIHPRCHQRSEEARHLDSGKMAAVTRTMFACLWALADRAERPRAGGLCGALRGTAERELSASVPRPTGTR